MYFLGQPCRNRSAEFARSSLSALGLPSQRKENCR
nr:MAG TPA: hypothetical protein [Caudoviricetes sp.]